MDRRALTATVHGFAKESDMTLHQNQDSRFTASFRLRAPSPHLQERKTEAGGGEMTYPSYQEGRSSWSLAKFKIVRIQGVNVKQPCNL